MQPRVLLDGMAMPESPRWHDGRLWFSNWGTRQIVAVDLDGNGDVVGEGPDGLGWATNWLPDGRMLLTGPKLIRVEPDGSRVRHADLSHISLLGWSEITVDGCCNVYVNTINFDFGEFDEVLGSARAPGKIALVTPDGEAREVAGELAFPNGMVITPDNKTLVVAESFAQRLTAFDIEDDGTLSNRRVWADGVGPDGICLDADGCIWASSANMANDCAVSAKAAKCSSGSISVVPASRPCSAAPTVGRCSCSRRTGTAPRESRTSSRRGRGRYWSPTRRRPASAGRNRLTRANRLGSVTDQGPAVLRNDFWN
jgi:sugar lactone lactonase YvrE